MKRRKFIASISSLLLLVACTKNKDSKSESIKTSDIQDGIALIIGARANNPSYHLSENLQEEIGGYIVEGKPIIIAKVSGKPTAQVFKYEKPLENQNQKALSQIKRQVVAGLTKEFESPAQDNGANLLEAIFIARDSLEANSASNKRILIFDNGLSESGILDFRQPGVLFSDPDTVIEYLKQSGSLPELQNIKITLSGIGYTAGEQPGMTSSQREKFTYFWKSMLTAGGAEVIVDQTPYTEPQISTEKTVEVVPIPEVKSVVLDSCEPSTLIFDSQSDVTFISDSNEFVDDGRARSALQDVAEWLKTNNNSRAQIVGTTANEGPMENQIQLAQLRAERVKVVLMEFGVSAESLSTSGVGSNFPEYVMPDRDANGLLLPGPASINRSVRITLDSSC